MSCAAFKEYDLKTLNNMGIKTPNIYEDLLEVKVHNGTRSKPLCKQLYHFKRNIN